MDAEIRAEIYERIEKLDEAAFLSYRNKEVAKSTDLLTQLIKLCESIDDKELIIQYRSWYCVLLRTNEKFKAALAETFATLNYAPELMQSRDYFFCYTEILIISTTIPTSYKSIENAIEKTKSLVEKTGLQHWYSALYYEVANVHSIRGNFVEALELAHLALTYWRLEHPTYMLDSHYDLIVFNALKLRDVETAKKTLALWENIENEYPVWRRMYLCERRIQMARLRKDKKKALNIARQIEHITEKTYDMRHLIEALLINLQTEKAKSLLVDFLRKERNSESLFRQATSWFLLGDYHYAQARLLLNLPPLDFEFDEIESEVIDWQTVSTEQKQKAKRFLERAKRNYQNSHTVTTEIDKRLECVHNSLYDSKLIERVEILLAVFYTFDNAIHFFPLE